MTYQHLTATMFENAKTKGRMVDQTIFKTAIKYGFNSLYFDEISLGIVDDYVQYVRPFLHPQCDYLLLNRNGLQSQKLTDLLSVLVFQAIGKYIHPTRYRQIIETESVSKLDLEEQRFVSEDQKHSSNVARVHYKRRCKILLVILEWLILFATEGTKCATKIQFLLRCTRFGPTYKHRPSFKC